VNTVIQTLQAGSDRTQRGAVCYDHEGHHAYSKTGYREQPTLFLDSTALKRASKSRQGWSGHRPRKRRHGFVDD